MSMSTFIICRQCEEGSAFWKLGIRGDETWEGWARRDEGERDLKAKLYLVSTNRYYIRHYPLPSFGSVGTVRAFAICGKKGHSPDRPRPYQFRTFLAFLIDNILTLRIFLVSAEPKSKQGSLGQNVSCWVRSIIHWWIFQMHYHIPYT
jgi:hypothetical protein